MFHTHTFNIFTAIKTVTHTLYFTCKKNTDMLKKGKGKHTIKLKVERLASKTNQFNCSRKLIIQIALEPLLAKARQDQNHRKNTKISNCLSLRNS